MAEHKFWLSAFFKDVLGKFGKVSNLNEKWVYILDAVSRMCLGDLDDNLFFYVELHWSFKGPIPLFIFYK